MGKPRSFDEYPEVMNTAGVAELFGYSVGRVELMCREGRLPAKKPAGSQVWQIRRDELLAWLQSDENRVKPAE